jgi:hypothetical protein
MANTDVTITRSNTILLSQPIIVNLAVSGTATFGTDYTVSGATSFNATSASVTIPANQTSKIITLSSVADTIVELDKTVVLTVVPIAGVSSGNGSVTWTILNDDFAVDPNIKLLLNLDGDFIDRSGTPKTFINFNSATFAITNPFGSGQSLATTNNSAIYSISPDFIIPTNTDFCLEGFVNYDGWGDGSDYHSPHSQYLFGLDSQALSLYYSKYPTGSGGNWGLVINQVNVLVVAASAPAINTWHFWQIQRNNAVITAYFNGVALGNVSSQAEIGNFNGGELRISQITAGNDYAYSVNGKQSNIRLTVGSIRPTAIPTAAF